MSEVEAAPESRFADCPFCESEISPTAKKCRFCGEWVQRDCLVCGTPIRREWAAAGKCASCSAKLAKAPEVPLALPRRKSKVTAGVLGIVLGGLGAHKFYLGKIGQGLLYAAVCWTGVPSVVGLIEGITYLVGSDERFEERYG